MLYERIELGKQVQKYADAITAFAAVQAVGFTLTIGKDSTIACIVKDRWPYAALVIALSYCFYAWLIHGCHKAEKVCAAERATEAQLRKVVATIHQGRLMLLSLTGIGLIMLVVGTGVLPVPPPCK